MTDELSRREMLSATSLAMGVAMATVTNPVSASESAGDHPFRYCLNTSTIRGQKLSLVEEVEIAAKAGYSGVEPWIREIERHVDDGGTLKDLRKRIDDLGLTVESAIGFADWISDDPAKRKEGLEQARRDMDLVRAIGGTRIAAPPAGARKTVTDLAETAKRYRELLDLGDKMGVVPQVEVWGFSKTLSRLGEAALVAIESGHPKACVLPDVYHIYKGGSDFHGLKLISGRAIHVFHVNDYPAAPERAVIDDSHRVYPGDGVAPLTQIFRDLRNNGFHGVLSLELFNRDYWKQDALQVARTGLEKTRAAVEKSLTVR